MSEKMKQGSKNKIKTGGTDDGALIYSRHYATSIVYILGIFVIAFGIVTIFTADPLTGIGIIVGSVFLFLPANIADDIQWKCFLVEFYGEKKKKDHENIIKELTDAEKNLMARTLTNEKPTQCREG